LAVVLVVQVLNGLLVLVFSMLAVEAVAVTLEQQKLRGLVVTEAVALAVTTLRELLELPILEAVEEVLAHQVLVLVVVVVLAL
jgi:hypothetical protein